MKKEAEDFLWFICLGIKADEVAKKDGKITTYLIEKCANRAYLDFCRTLKFDKKNLKKIQNSTKKSPENIKKDFRAHIIEYLESEIQNNFQAKCKTIEDFNAKHFEICKEIITKSQNYRAKNTNYNILEKSLSYGHAQKWLNMTLKYLWLTGQFDDKRYLDPEWLHIPVDRYIIRAVADKGVFPQDPSRTWSKWTDDIYNDFREKLSKQYEVEKKEKNYQSPLQWENELWIEQAKNETP